MLLPAPSNCTNSERISPAQVWPKRGGFSCLCELPSRGCTRPRAGQLVTFAKDEQQPRNYMSKRGEAIRWSRSSILCLYCLRNCVVLRCTMLPHDEHSTTTWMWLSYSSRILCALARRFSASFRQLRWEMSSSKEVRADHQGMLP